VQALVGRITDRRVVTFGFNAQADVRAVNLRYKGGVAHFDIALRAEDKVIEGCTLPMPGDHNVSNALAAVAVARHLGMKRDEIRDALAGFRRREPALYQGGRGWWRHHHRRLRTPSGRDRRRSEGRAAGRGDRPGARVIAVHQPHRYTRLSSLFDDFCACFNDADVVGIAEVFAAGEEPIPGASRDDLVAG
jgi:UDP-N-acetylmuramate--alanine ligase